MKGITLLELVLVMAILAILGAVAVNFYVSSRSTIELDEERNRIVAGLREAKGNAIAGEQGYAWGIHFDNITAASPFFTLFAGTNYAASSTTTRHDLGSAVEYEVPGAGAAFDIIFAKRSATTTAATTTIRLRTIPSEKQSVAVSGQGLITK